MARILEPAIELARQGAVLSEMQAYVIDVVSPIVTADPMSRTLFASPSASGKLIAAGERLAWPALADLLEALGREGERLFYEGEIGSEIVAACRDQGGHLTADDLAGYQVEQRPPLDRRFAGARILTNPPPIGRRPADRLCARPAVRSRAGIEGGVRHRSHAASVARHAPHQPGAPGMQAVG